MAAKVTQKSAKSEKPAKKAPMSGKVTRYGAYVNLQG